MDMTKLIFAFHNFSNTSKKGRMVKNGSNDDTQVTYHSMGVERHSLTPFAKADFDHI